MNLAPISALAFPAKVLSDYLSPVSPFSEPRYLGCTCPTYYPRHDLVSLSTPISAQYGFSGGRLQRSMGMSMGMGGGGHRTATRSGFSADEKHKPPANTNQAGRPLFLVPDGHLVFHWQILWMVYSVCLASVGRMADM
ncbi:uncharacterized protein LY79DRAFT_575666 [Colletotrichum navitas]|uniref:Uncharacterized protein n=1 Tax=Colletotrichum navitas TaxID=681940 RepID=A0AAD8QCL1_9PEZI|nr:uncharacterized protein LY79DRAFT_575666 [Colletotrichum navitas]KAK1599127.1 hypothetical protein LY79DRAFT_575666 [Colletotrichum navitas]